MSHSHGSRRLLPRLQRVTPPGHSRGAPPPPAALAASPRPGDAPSPVPTVGGCCSSPAVPWYVTCARSTLEETSLGGGSRHVPSTGTPAMQGISEPPRLAERTAVCSFPCKSNKQPEGHRGGWGFFFFLPLVVSVIKIIKRPPSHQKVDGPWHRNRAPKQRLRFVCMRDP